MKNAIRWALCLVMGTTSAAAYASAYERPFDSAEAGEAEAKPIESAPDATTPMVETTSATAEDAGYASGEPMGAGSGEMSTRTADPGASSASTLRELDHQRYLSEVWAPAP